MGEGYAAVPKGHKGISTRFHRHCLGLKEFLSENPVSSEALYFADIKTASGMEAVILRRRPDSNR